MPEDRPPFENVTEENEDLDEEVSRREAQTDLEGGMEMVPASDILPEVIAIIPLEQRPLFPGITMPLHVTEPALVEAARVAAESPDMVLGAVYARDFNQEHPERSELHEFGTALKILRFGIGDGFAQMLVQSVRRFRIVEELSQESVRRCRVEYFTDAEGPPNEELKAYTIAVISSVKELLQLNNLFQEQLKMLLSNMTYDRPGLIMDLIAALLSADGDKLQPVLGAVPLAERAEILLRLLQEELQLYRLQKKIKEGIEEKITEQQKRFFLQEQLHAIKKELGLEKEDKESQIEKFRERLQHLHLSAEAEKVVEDELQKISLLEPVSPEYNVTHTYLDWLTILPWGVYSEDNFDIKHAQEVLNRDHYGLEDVKERILEFVSTGIKTGNIAGSILCFVGPPGVGKTSIGRSVAEALNRKFFRFSVGGMRDEAEIKGHRRTYIGAMPGKFLQSLKTVGTSNPVVMLDEIDKIGVGFRGDPASALLEVLDPEQNRDFLDHYLDVRFDLSRCLFITTANQLDTIPSPLLDRMEVIKLSGYIMEEKLEIAKRYLLPRAMRDHGLSEGDVSVTDDGLRFIADRYAREAGVRNLENSLKKIMRRITRLHADGRTDPVSIDPDNVQEFLRQPVFPEEQLFAREIPGVVVGLAWTTMGGAVLHIEANAMLSKSAGYKQTGQLGSVMQESAEIAYSHIRSNSVTFGLDPDFFEKRLIHLHVPAGATPKDGPSAGVTMALALYSIASARPVPRTIAMTGELTLTGKVLPVGGIKEKVIAARRAGIRRLILPKDNLKDYKELPDYIRAGLTLYFVGYFEDVVKVVFPPAE